MSAYRNGEPTLVVAWRLPGRLVGWRVAITNRAERPLIAHDGTQAFTNWPDKAKAEAEARRLAALLKLPAVRREPGKVIKLHDGEVAFFHGPDRDRKKVVETA